MFLPVLPHSVPQVYYYNKVLTNSSKLEWLADTGKIDQRTDGRPYLDIFIKGIWTDDSHYVYAYGYNNVDATAYIQINEDKDLVFAVSYYINKGKDNQDRVMVEFTYEKVDWLKEFIFERHG